MYFWLHWVFIAVRGLSLVAVLRLLLAVVSLALFSGIQNAGSGVEVAGGLVAV